MTLASNIQSTLLRHQQAIDATLRRAMSAESDILPPQADIVLRPFYGQMEYHLGWVDSCFAPTRANPGKLLRPTLLLLAYEAAGAWGLANEEATSSEQTAAYLHRALFAAAAIELTHNCTLIHDDIEDGDTERRHRATVWSLWGIPQATNTGDGLYTLARMTLWRVMDEGVDAEIAARLGALLDRTCLAIFEGQFLDMSFEQRLDISPSMYLNMINRKTAALMACAVEMGGYLGTRDVEIIQSLRSFGWALGTAFQVRDDLLGIWDTAELGKSPAGDIYKRKKTLPVIHAFEHASDPDAKLLREIYEQESPVTQEQVAHILEIFARTESRAYCQNFLAQQCSQARVALANVPRGESAVTARAFNDMETIVDFLEEAAR
jgi:geranylgeranyl diphosphate synthase type I